MHIFTDCFSNFDSGCRVRFPASSHNGGLWWCAGLLQVFTCYTCTADEKICFLCLENWGTSTSCQIKSKMVPAHVQEPLKWHPHIRSEKNEGQDGGNHPTGPLVKFHPLQSVYSIPPPNPPISLELGIFMNWAPPQADLCLGPV